MSPSLITEANPQVIADDATIEEVDIDHVAVNTPLNHEATDNVVKSFPGNTVQLATEKGRNWHCEGWNFLIICWNPV
jgi:hypothetical protein